MALRWRQLTRGLRVLVNRTAADQDVADEVQNYMEEATAALMASGLSTEEARRAARLELGNATVIREQVRAYGWENVIGTLLSDLRYGARRLRRSPGFAAVSVATLALGIGASTAIFSAVNPILFEPLPYPHAERITMIWDFGDDGSRLDVTFGTYRELVERSRSFDAIAVMRAWQPTMTGHDRARTIRRAARERKLLPRAGRVAGASDGTSRTSDDQVNGPKVVILSDGLWRRRFGGDSAIVGRQVTLDDNRYTVIGVMPSGFENVLAPSAELWTPLQYDRSLPPEGREWGHHLRMVGRLRPGVGADQASRELDTIARDPVPAFPRVPLGIPREGIHREFAAGRRHERRQTGAARRPRRGRAGARDRVRERDESAARSRRTAARRIRGARRARRGTNADDPATAHRESAAGRSRRRARNGRGGVRRPGVRGAQSARAAAGGRDRRGRHRLRLRPGHHHADRPGGRADSGAARVSRRPARRTAAKLTSRPPVVTN